MYGNDQGKINAVRDIAKELKRANELKKIELLIKLHEMNGSTGEGLTGTYMDVIDEI